MAIIAHRHDFAATADGYKCINCDARVPNALVVVTPGHPDIWHLWKKLNL